VQETDGQIVSREIQARPALTADRRIRAVVDLATRSRRNPRVQESHQGAKNAALRLTPKPEQNHIVFAENTVDQVRKNRLVIPYNTGKKDLLFSQRLLQVSSHFILDAAASGMNGVVRAFPEISESLGRGLIHDVNTSPNREASQISRP
jgi:hypothetical protein